tara:strand:+ start:939 stop:1334 length:396 start_codon:yes stop_codon:yes gene_type:complete
MNKIVKEFFRITVFLSLFISFLYQPIVQAFEFDLTAAQDAVGERFASKFCEAKKEGFTAETSSEFALNNTYLKFVAFPDDDKFIKDLWAFTIERINKDCGDYITENEENNLKDFFEEEGNIASNRDMYLPH